MHDFPNRSLGSQRSDIVADAASIEATDERDSEQTKEYIEQAQQGNSEALHYLYIRYAPAVSRYVRRMTRDDHQAEDITHDVFMKVITAIDKYEPREVPFAAWVLRVARNATIDYLRACRSIPCEEIHLHSEDRERIGRERRRDLEQALNHLPTEQRNVFVLRHIVGLSPVEIASMLGKTESSIHGLHHRGRMSMQSSLRQLGTTPVVAA